LTGETTPDKSIICQLFGSTTPFDSATLATLYPKHARYVAAVRKSADRAVERGFLLPADARQLIKDAQAAKVPG